MASLPKGLAYQRGQRGASSVSGQRANVGRSPSGMSGHLVRGMRGGWNVTELRDQGASATRPFEAKFNLKKNNAGDQRELLPTRTRWDGGGGGLPNGFFRRLLKWPASGPPLTGSLSKSLVREFKKFLDAQQMKKTPNLGGIWGG